MEGELIVQPDYDIVHPLQKSGFMVKTDAVSEWTFISKDATIEEKFPNWVQTDTVFKTYADKTARIAGSSGDVKFLKVEIPQLVFDQNGVGYTMKRKTPISTPPYEMIETIDYIAPQYDSIKYLNPMSFDTLLAKKKGQWGIISTKNLTLVNQQYDDIKPQITHVKIDSIFKKGATYFGASRNGKWGVVSGLDTSVVVNFEYDDVEIYYLPLRKTVDSSAMRLFFKVKKDGKWGLIGEKTWELLVPIEFEKILVDKTKNGFRLLKDSQEGYFITAARKTLPPIYKEVHFFRNGFARVRTKDDKIGYVNENGLEYFD